MADGSSNQLKVYWTRPGEPGYLRIRWGTPGDWTRCVRHLTEHVGAERARRMCQIWHIEVTGVATGSRLNPGNR